jgi:neurofibromin 1
VLTNKYLFIPLLNIEILLRSIEFGLGKICNSDGAVTTSEKNTLFAEQAIGILKQLLERILEATGSLNTVDFSGLFLSLTRYCHHLGTDWLSLRVKIKMCQLLEVMMQKRDLITLKQEISLRNTFAGLLLDWISDISLVILFCVV